MMPYFQNSHARKKFESVMVAYVNYNTDFEVCPLLLYVSSSLCRFTVPHTFFLFLIFAFASARNAVHAQRVAVPRGTDGLPHEEGIFRLLLPPRPHQKDGGYTSSFCISRTNSVVAC